MAQHQKDKFLSEAPVDGIDRFLGLVRRAAKIGRWIAAAGTLCAIYGSVRVTLSLVVGKEDLVSDPKLKSGWHLVRTLDAQQFTNGTIWLGVGLGVLLVAAIFRRKKTPLL